ncbi:MAG: NAD(P)H-hydrate dehydratase [Planctomycetota bacterium]|nr:MAG: NAD(P)H-hydrate dehydratase [Planctomycetota bacterium]
MCEVFRRANGAVVLDADGLNALAEFRGGDANPLVANGSDCKRPAMIVTPHPGEMARLRAAAGMPELKGDDDETRLRVAHEYAIRSGATVVLKGHRTVVCTSDRAYINTTGNPGMATGGMGDVLTGLIAALLGQGLEPFDAGRLAAHVHGAAADLCARRVGPVGYLARDVAEHIPPALAQVISAPIGFGQ